MFLARWNEKLASVIWVIRHRLGTLSRLLKTPISTFKIAKVPGLTNLRVSIVGATFFAVFSQAISSSVILADTRNILGIDFEVERAFVIDRNNSSVTIDGRELIVPSNEVDDYIVESLLLKKQRKGEVTIASLGSFTEQAIAEKRYDIAVNGLSSLINGGDQAIPIMEQLVEKFQAQPGAIDLFKRALLHQKPDPKIDRRVVVPIIVAIARNDETWVANMGAEWLKDSSDEIRQHLERIFSKALFTNGLESIDELTTVARRIFGSESLLVQQFQDVRSRVQLITDAVKRGGANDLIKVFKDTVATMIPLPNGLYEMMSLRGHDLAESLIERGQASQAIEILAYLEFDKRTPRTHELLIRAIQGIKIREAKILFTNIMVPSLIKYAQKDEIFGSEFIDIGKAYVRDLMRSGNMYQAEDIFLNLEHCGPQYDYLLDPLRLDFADTYIVSGDTARAKDKLKSVEVTRGLWVFTQFLWLVFRMNQSLLMFILMIATAIFSGLYYYYRINKDDDDLDLTMFDPHEAFKGGFVKNVQRKLDPRFEEYLRSVHLLGLKPGCSEREIKAAYRRIAKKLHPDAGASKEKSEKFLTLHNTYNRLIELEEKYQFSKQVFID